MSTIELEIAARKYHLACRDGEEAKLRSVAAMVDKKARDAAAALGTMPEARQLLFAALLLADELKDQRAGEGTNASAEADASLSDALERLADQVESLAARLERADASS